MRASNQGLLLLAAVTPPLLAGAWRCSEARAADVEDIMPGTPVELALDPEEGVYPVFRVRVPSRATGLRLWTTDATHDVELYVNFIDHPDPEIAYYDLVGPNIWVDEDLMIEVSDSYALEAGEWFVTVVPSLLLPEIEDGPVRCSLHCDLVVPEPVPIALGEAHEVALHRDQGLRAAFRVALPDDLAADAELTVEAVSTEADITLVAGRPGAGRLLRSPYRSADSSLPYERMVLTGDEVSRGLELHVYAYSELEPWETVRATIRVGLGRAAALVPAPAVPAGPQPGPLGTALAATVSVYGPLGSGSGVVVSPDGWILTNAHVVSGVQPGRQQRHDLAELSIGFNLDPRRPALPALGAELVEYSEDLDLALLRVTGTLDLRPLPEPLAMPAMLLAPPPGPRPGDDLWVLGYPMTGGSGSLVSITVTRGLHSGWSKEAEGLVIKTDAATHSGTSGGACVDAAGRLVGLPSASISDANMAGGLGFVIPVELVPDAWRALFEG